MKKIPLLRILRLESLDRVSPTFWPVFFAVIFIALGLIVSFLKLLAWIGGFVLFAYALMWGFWLWSKVKK